MKTFIRFIFPWVYSFFFLVLGSSFAFADAVTNVLPINIQNNNTVTYTNYPFIIPVNNTQLASLGYISATGLNTQVSRTTTSSNLPSFLTGGNLTILVDQCLGNRVNSYSYKLGYTPARVFTDIIEGNGGSLSVLDNAVMEPGYIGPDDSSGATWNFRRELTVLGSSNSTEYYYQKLLRVYRAGVDSSENIAQYTTGDDFSNGAITATVWVGDSFTAETTAVVKKVWLKLLRVGSPTGTYSCGIRSSVGGLPSGATLCSGNISAANISSSADWYELDMGGGTLLTSGVQYTLLFYGGISDAGNYLTFRYDSTSAYSGGCQIYSVDGGASFASSPVICNLFQVMASPSSYSVAENPITVNTIGIPLGNTTECQTFTSSITGVAEKVWLPLSLYGSPTGVLNVTIWNTTGADSHPFTRLTSGSFLSVSSISSSDLYGWYAFNLGSGFSVTSGTKYAIVIVANTSIGGNYVGVGLDSAAPYTGGEEGYSLDNSLNWTMRAANYDVVFKITSSKVSFGIGLGGKCQPDFDDLRFTEEDSTTILPYWIENQVTCERDGYADCWVRLNTITKMLSTSEHTHYYIYYGNAAASAPVYTKIKYECYNPSSLTSSVNIKGSTSGGGQVFPCVTSHSLTEVRLALSSPTSVSGSITVKLYSYPALVLMSEGTCSETLVSTTTFPTYISVTMPAASLVAGSSYFLYVFSASVVNWWYSTGSPYPQGSFAYLVGGIWNYDSTKAHGFEEWGNPGGFTPIQMTMAFGDDFNDASLDTINRWGPSGTGTYSEAGGILTVSSPTELVSSLSSFGINYMARALFRANAVASLFGFIKNVASWDGLWTSGCYSGSPIFAQVVSSDVAFDVISSGITYNSGYNLWDVVRTSGGAISHYNGTSAGNYSSYTTNSPRAITLATGGGAGYSSYCDWVFVSKFQTSQPLWGNTGLEVKSSFKPISKYHLQWSGYLDSSIAGTIFGKPGSLVLDTLGTGNIRVIENSTVIIDYPVPSGVHSIYVYRSTPYTVSFYLDGVFIYSCASGVISDNSNSWISQSGPARSSSYFIYSRGAVTDYKMVLRTMSFSSTPYILDLTGNNNYGTIAWGTNPLGTDSYTSGMESAGSLVMGPSSIDPDTEVTIIPVPGVVNLSGNDAVVVTSLPVYDLVNRAAISLGWTPQVLYGVLMWMTAVAMGAGAFIATGSLFGGGIMLIGTLAVASSTTVIPAWIPIVMGLALFFIVVLSRSL